MNSSGQNGGSSSQPDIAPRLFEMFFDLHHPAASLHCQRARMVKPPEGHDDRLCAEICKPSFITNILCFAFPDFFLDRDGRKFEGKARLNRFDVYIQAFLSQRHTFTLRGSSGYVLYGHVLRYLSPNPEAVGRPDVGRRETRAMVLLTRAGGGDRFFSSILKTLEACMAQSAVDYRLCNSGNAVAEKAIHFLHSVYRAHLAKTAELMLRVQRGEHVNNFDDHFMIISGIEWTPSPAELKRDRVVRGGWVTFRLPNSLQPGYKPGIAPDDIDSPIMPLIRCLSPDNILSALSALLCEGRVIFISSDATKLSACVHAASAMLAQGCLSWVHVFFPVLPPHMLKCLSSQTPYLVGVLEIFVDSIQGLSGMTDVLRIDLDRDELRTYNMANPAATIPEISNGNKKQSKPFADASSVGDVLLAEIDEIQKTERRTWGGSGVTITSDEKNNENRREDGSGSLWGMLGSSKRSLTAETQSEYAPAAFGPTRGWMSSDQKPPWRHPGKPVTVFDVCDNDQGEASIRAALLIFFLSLHGDLANLLTEDRTTGKFEVDRRKYLLSKKRQGVLEDSNIFHFYRVFCSTTLLTQHVHYRVSELDGYFSVLLPHHLPLFLTCAKTLGIQRMAFSVDNVRKVVSKLIASSSFHAMADHHENVRSVAFELTASQDTAGDVLKPLRSLISSSYECDGALGHVVSVAWSRLDDPKGKPKHILLALHLLKILLQNGPITTLSILTDGFNKVRALKKFSIAKINENKEIHESAAEVCELISNHNLLFTRRKFTLSNYSQHDDVVRKTGWGSYFIRRLPITVGFQAFHELLSVPQLSPIDNADASTAESTNSERARGRSTRSSRSQDVSTNASLQQKIPFVHAATSGSLPMRNITDGFSPGDIARTLQRTRSAFSKSVRSSALPVQPKPHLSDSSNWSGGATTMEKEEESRYGLSRSPSTRESSGSVTDDRGNKMRGLRQRAQSEGNISYPLTPPTSTSTRSSSSKRRDDWSRQRRSISADSIEESVESRDSHLHQKSSSERKHRTRSSFRQSHSSSSVGASPTSLRRSVSDRRGSAGDDRNPAGEAISQQTSTKSNSTESTSRKSASPMTSQHQQQPQHHDQHQQQPSLSLFLDSEVVIHARQGSRVGCSDPTEESCQDSFSTLGFPETAEHKIQTGVA